MADDVVAELDRWQTIPRIAQNAHEFVPIGELLIRARDEIVRLRAQLKAVAPLRIAIADALAAARREARDAALEEAAHECDEEAKGSSEGFRDGCETCAASIRALKERPHD